MEVIAIIVAIFAVAYAFSLSADIKKLDQRELAHWNEFDRAIRQLQDLSLNATDRATLDRLNAAAARARQRGRDADDG